MSHYPKKDGKFWVYTCRHYKVTINPALQVDQYPLLKPDDPFETLAGDKSSLPSLLSQAYLQLSLEEGSSTYSTINTHKGLYRFNCLSFSIVSVPAVFQKTMDEILQGIPKATCYMDDILITGANDMDHLETLKKVLTQLEKHGVRAKHSKCCFLSSLSHILDTKVMQKGSMPFQRN